MFTEPLPLRVNHSLLALENQTLQGVIDLAEFNRLAETLLESVGEVRVKLEFRKARRHKTLVVGQCATSVRLICQNCLCPLDFSLQAAVHHFIVCDEKGLLALSDDEGGIISAENVISLVDIFEDELLLNLPMAAKHSEAERQAGRCKLDTLHPMDTLTSETHRPLANLADLRHRFNRS